MTLIVCCTPASALLSHSVRYMTFYFRNALLGWENLFVNCVNMHVLIEKWREFANMIICEAVLTKATDFFITAFQCLRRRSYVLKAAQTRLLHRRNVRQTLIQVPLSGIWWWFVEISKYATESCTINSSNFYLLRIFSMIVNEKLHIFHGLSRNVV